MNENKFIIVSNNPLSGNSQRVLEWNLYQDVANEFNIEIKNILTTTNRTDSYYDSLLKNFDDDELPFAGVLTGTRSYSELAIFKDMEYRGTRFINPTTSIVGDKLNLSVEAKHNNIPVPKTVPIVLPNLAVLSEVAEYIIDAVGLPCVIKKADWGLGFGIIKVNNYNDLIDTLGLLGAAKFTDMFGNNYFNFIAQEFIPDNIGAAVRVLVLNDKCIASIFKKTSHWKANSTFSDRITEIYPMNPVLEELSLRICKVFNITYAGLDFHIMDDGKYLLGEINLYPLFGFISKSFPDINVPLMILQHLMPHKF